MVHRYTSAEYIVEPCRDKTQPHQALPTIFHTGHCLDSQMDPGNKQLHSVNKYEVGYQHR